MRRLRATSEESGVQYKLGQNGTEYDLRGSYMQEWVEDYVGEMQQSLKGRSSTVGRENALSVRCALPSTEKMRTLASLSAARCAYMFGCSDTLAMLLACGNEERPLDKLGRATSLSAGARRELDC
jgi:hypothetical protein